jgi:precorrin-4 methylase
MAFLNFEEELQNYLSLLKDQKLTHSVAHAVDTDAPNLEELRTNDLQAVEDCMFVSRLTSEDPELEKAVNSKVPIIEDETKKPNGWCTWPARRN